MGKLKIRRDDQVIVTYGRSKGKKGQVLEVCGNKTHVIVKDVNIVHRHTKSSAKTSGGIIKKESPIHISNISLIDPDTDKPTKVGFKFDDNGSKVRFSKKSGKIL
jgi:large subunit ribosomal protein L24